MNKIFSFFYFMFFSLILISKAHALDQLITLETLNHQGALVDRQVFMINSENVVTINGEKLSPAEIITQSHHIHLISSFDKESSAPNEICKSGQFNHFYFNGSVHKKETGCLESKRFKELRESFRFLKKDKVTQ